MLINTVTLEKSCVSLFLLWQMQIKMSYFPSTSSNLQQDNNITDGQCILHMALVFNATSLDHYSKIFFFIYTTGEMEYPKGHQETGPWPWNHK